MRKKTIKAKIAATLSASMALAMLAPAMPAYAAITYAEIDHNLNTPATYALYGGHAATIGNVSSGQEGLLGFDFTTLTPSISGWVKNIAVNGNPGEAIGFLDLPYFPSGTFSGTASFNSKYWNNDLDLEGYMIKGYNQAPLRAGTPGFPGSSAIEVTNLSAQGAVYYAELEADPSKKFDYVVAHEGDNVYLPGDKYDNSASTMVSTHNAVVDPATENIPTTGGREVLTTFQANYKSIPGYKTVAPVVKLYKSATATEWTGNSGFSISNDRVSGDSINKDTFITFKYVPNQDVKFKLTVVDNYYNYEEHPSGGVTIGEGSHINAGELKRSGSPRSVTRTGNKSYYATEAVNTDGATKALDGTYKLDSFGNIDLNPGAAVEYILDPENPVEFKYSYDFEDNNASPDFGKFKNSLGNVVDTLIPAKFNTNSTGFTPLYVSGVANGYRPEGQMLNQNVTIKYNYIKNPNYYRGITINYVDDEGSNINSKIVDKLGVTDLPASPAIPTVGTVYKNPTSGSLFIRVDSTSGTNYTIPLPKLDTYLAYDTSPTGIPTVEPESTTSWDANFTPVSGSIATELGAGGVQAWGASNEDLNINAATGVGANNNVTVTYTRDVGSIAVINPITNTGGTLKVPAHINNIGLNIPEHEYGGGTYPSGGAYAAAGVAGQPIDDTVSLPRVKNVPASTYHVNVDTGDLPTPVADNGYRFRGWKMTDGSWLSVNSFSDDNPAITAKSLPADTLEQSQSMSAVTLTAIFEIDPSRWTNFKLMAGDTHVTFNNGNDAKVLNYDYTLNTARTNIPSSDLNDWIDESQGAMSVDAGYTLVWYDEDFAPVDFTTINLADYRDGYTFTAYARTSTPAQLYAPQVTGSLSQTSGVPVITVDALSPAAMDIGLNYIVADSNGKVVSVVSGAQLMSNAGKISGSALHPGESYKVYTALPTSGATVGSGLPGTGISAPSDEVTIPVVVNAQASEDDNNPGMAQIIIDPADPNTQYALLDPSGNVVYDFTSPDSANKVTFKNLEPDKVYTIVPRPVGSSESPAARKASGVKTEDINTGNLGITATVFPVTVIANNANLPGTTTSIRVNGANKTLNDLTALRFGQSVSIDAEPIDNNGALFKEWRVISGNTGHTGNIVNDPSGRISFTMPRGPVKLQVLYDDGINFAPDNYPNRAQFAPNTIGVTYPTGASGITTPGLYRINITQKKVSAANEALIQSNYTDVYKGEFEFSVIVEVSTDNGSSWSKYEGADAPSVLEASVHTGALASTRSYSLYKLATSSNAITNIPGVYDTKGGGSGYSGEFTQSYDAGETYIFGYTSSGTTVRFIRVPDMSTVKTIVVKTGSKLSDYESDYLSSLPKKGDVFSDGDTGITWTYEDLSMRSDKKENVNRNLIIDSDKTIYLYYTDDKEYRGKLVDGLNDSLLKADRIDESKYNASDVAALKAKASEAREILNRAAPNKAFSPELAKVLEELNALLNKLGISTKPTPNKPDNNNRGGGSGGGGGGRGSSRSTGGSKTENTVKVGTDGSWQLLNPEEKDLSKSQWVFNLTSGKRLTAWAYLSYTYDGHTKLAWYHFDSNGIMDSGWFCDTDGRWYYLSTNHDGFFGEMMTGWHLDMDGRWYYLNPNGGAMMTGWAKVGNDYYYLSPSLGANRPFGSMYHNEQTPDGYTVNEQGAWK